MTDGRLEVLCMSLLLLFLVALNFLYLCLRVLCHVVDIDCEDGLAVPHASPYLNTAEDPFLELTHGLNLLLNACAGSP